MQKPGFHYRITDINIIGLSQLKKLKNLLIIDEKLQIFTINNFLNLKICKPLQLNMRKKSANHLYVLKINFEK